MTKKELRAAIKECKFVFGWVNVFADMRGETVDGAYLQVQKQSVLALLDKVDDDVRFNASVRGDGSLYLR